MRTSLVAIIGASVALAAAALTTPGSQAAVPQVNNGVWHLVDGTGRARGGAPVLWVSS